MVGWGRLLLPEILGKTDPVEHNADFQSIFARIASAVIPIEKSSINTNTESATSFPMSLRWTVYVPPKVTLNDLKCRILPNSIVLQADYVIVVEDKSMMFAKYRLPVIFGQNW